MSHLSDALDLNRNVVIRACAGAGKTYALTKRYLAILDTFAKVAETTDKSEWQGPQNILVITFTNKATAEMSHRIYRDIHRILAASEMDEGTPGFMIHHSAAYGYAQWLVESFSRARIMTIDSLCSRIIRENPVQAGIDPGISVVNDESMDIVFNTTLRPFLHELFNKRDDRLTRLISRIGLFHLKNAMRYLSRHEYELTKWETRLQSASPAEIFRRWRANYEPALPFREMMEHYTGVLEQVFSLRLTAFSRENFSRHRHKVTKFFSVSESQQPAYYKIHIHPEFTTKQGSYSKQLTSILGTAAEWNTESGRNNDRKTAGELLKTFLTKLSERIPAKSLEQIFSEDDLLNAECLRDIVGIYRELAPSLEKAKKEENVLAYQDVIDRTYELLKNHHGLARRYGQSYPHIMVDEFQDTNDLRWEIIRMLASDDGKLRTKGIFIVGDEKQSVYRFQNADVKVMRNAVEDLLGAETPPAIIEFNSNYRSSEEFIQKAVNPLFTRLFKSPGDTAEPFEPVFSPTTYPENKPDTDCEKDKSMGGSIRINLMTVAHKYLEKPGKVFRQDRLAYPRHVAQLIKAFRETPQYRRLNMQDNAPKIGVLLRTMKNNIARFREAFQQEGLDFEVVGGRGFYTRQEILDIEMLLAVLINPLDDVAMTGVLRSPLFAVDDELLTKILLPDRGKKSVFQVISPALDQVRNEIGQWRDQCFHLPVDRVLESVFSAPERELGYLSEPDGEQRWKNIKKCIRIIHNWSVAGNDLAEIRRKLHEKIINKDTEDLAPMVTSSEVIIMSIHKAKGLDFPFVVIPDIHRKFNYRQSDSMLGGILSGKTSDNYEFGLSMSKIDGSADRSVLMKMMKARHKREDFAEYIRLLYVAVTRAKYGVLLSGIIEEKKDGTFPEPRSVDQPESHFLDWIRTTYDIQSDELHESIIPHPFAQIDVTSYEPSLFSAEDSIRESICLPDSRQGTIPDVPVIHRMSVHELSERCFVTDSLLPDAETDYYGKAFGTFIHWVLENRYYNIPKYKTILLEKAASFAEGHIKMSESEWLNYVTELSEMEAVGMLESLPSGKLFTEHAIEGILQSKDGLSKIALTGIIDSLYLHNGEWVVRDYKTDTTDYRLEQYKVQVQIYLHMAKAMYHFPVLKGELVYTSQKKVIPVPFNPAFFSSITLYEQTGWSFSPPPASGMDLPEALESPRDDMLVICPTQYRISQLKRELSNRNRLNPAVMFETISSLNNRYHSESASSLLIRLLLRKHLKNEFHGQSFQEFPGLLRALSRAYDLGDRHGYPADAPLASLFQRIESELKNTGIQPWLSPESFPLTVFAEKHVIVDGWLPVFRKEQEFLNLVEKHAKRLTMLKVSKDEAPLFPRPEPLPSQGPVNRESLCWYRPFDPDDEMRFMAAKIREELNRGIPIEDILIVLPSMEKLVPPMIPVFKAEGIPVQLAKGEPVLERPVIQACLRLLEIFSSQSPTWNQLFAWFRHPMALAAAEPDMDKAAEGISQLDIIFRRSEKSGIPLDVSSSFSEITNDDRLNYAPTDEMTIAMAYIRQSMAQWHSDTAPFYLAYTKQIEWLSSRYGGQDEMDRLSLKTFLASLDELNHSIRTHFAWLSVHGYRVELMNILQNRDIPTRLRMEGISVVSVMESVNHTGGKIVFVPGLASGDFPSATPAGFLMPDVPDYHFQTNRQIFDSWLSQSKRIYLSCASRGVDGAEQPASLFLENLGKVQIPKPYISPFKLTLGKNITIDDSLSPAMTRQIRRHNAMLENPSDSSYFGKLSTRIQLANDRYFSASQLKDLQDAPLLFLMKHIWKIRETDPVTSIPLILGNLVHDILDRFGKEHPDGWTLNRRNHESACKLLDRIAVERTGKSATDNFELPLQLKPFLIGLQSPSETHGLFKNLLSEDRTRMAEFQFVSSEQPFGYTDSIGDKSYPELTFEHPELGIIKFRGTIDRIDVHSRNHGLIGMDFKTGKIPSGNSLEDLPPQLKLYYLVLKQRYPDHRIWMVYRQLHRLKDRKWGFKPPWLGDPVDETPDLLIDKKDLKKSFFSNDIAKDIERDILSVLEPLATGCFRPFSQRSPGKKVSYFYLEAPSRMDIIKYHSDGGDNPNDSDE